MLRVLAGLTAVAGVVFVWGSFASALPAYMPILSVIVTALMLFADGTFGQRFKAPVLLQFLVGISAVAFIMLGFMSFVSGLNLLPAWTEGYWPPPDAAIVAVIVVAINYGIGFIPVTRTIIDLVNPYFEETAPVRADLGILGRHTVQERRLAFVLFATILFLNIVQVYLTVLLSFWGSRFYTALSDKDYATFKVELLVFAVLATLWVVRGLAELYITYLFKINWRRWLTERYVGHWLSDKNHYRLSLARGLADNPDQRISEDVDKFIDNTNDWYVQFFVTSLGLYAFIRILWSLSERFSYTIGGFDLSSIPGYLVWVALALALVATLGAHFLGRPLVGLEFNKQRLEANFRYSLVRVRENTEQIALLNGEETERRQLMGTFGGVFSNTLQVAMRQTILRCFTLTYQQAMVVVPLVLLAPAYFTNPLLKYGLLQQTRGAFSDVQDAFSFFVTYYSSLAVYKAVVNRLLGFEAALVEAEDIRAKGLKVVTRVGEGRVGATDIDVSTPTGKTLLHGASFELEPRNRTLITGFSGSGKTTLFRAIAGIWPFGKGRIEVPENANVMMLPQQAYLPQGTLREVLTYPSAPDAFPQEALVEGLAAVGLEGHVESLDVIENWTNALSGGEKQRVSLVRALLRKPAWLFLDEATSAVDEATEASLYELLRERLPETTIVSIGHRSSLAALHDRRLAIVKDGAGTRLEDAPLEAFGARA